MTEQESAAARSAGTGWQELAVGAIDDAAQNGFDLVIVADTPVIPDETFPFETYVPHLTERGTWADMDAMARHWSSAGCSWVNLRFGIEPDGTAIVRYEAKPDGYADSDDETPHFNGGFDLHRLVSPEEFRRRNQHRLTPD